MSRNQLSKAARKPRQQRVGLGTAQLSNTDGKSETVRYMSKRGARQILAHAISLGVRFFDTGVHYGEAEALLGEAKRTHAGSIFVATKIGLNPNGVRDFSIPFLRAQIDESIARLGPLPIDLLQLNKPNISDFSSGDLVSFIEKLKKDKQIRYFGIVAPTPDSATYFIQNLDDLDSIQVFFNLIHTEGLPALKLAAKRGIHTVVRSPLNSGLLSGQYTESTRFDPNDERNNYFRGATYEKRIQAVKRIQKELTIPDSKMIQFSLSYVLSQDSVDVVIPGASSVAQLEQYVLPSIGQKHFTPDELNKIDSVVNKYYGTLRSEALVLHVTP
jgi:myo-inositol catabolism protein IolS